MKKNAQFRLAVSARNIFLAVAVLITAGFWSSSAFAAKPDFSGQWKLNEGKSEIGEGRFRPSATLEVKQDKTNLVVVSTRTGRDGTEQKTESTYSLDGKETTSGDENRTTVSTVKWSDDGKSLAIHSKRSFTREGQTFETETDETWMLGEGGKVLSIQSKSSSSRGESSAKLVYDKV
jgi:dipeptidyl aminopeptidase/acylaminoacyl peptidase